MKNKGWRGEPERHRRAYYKGKRPEIIHDSITGNWVVFYQNRNRRFKKEFSTKEYANRFKNLIDSQRDIRDNF